MEILHINSYYAHSIFYKGLYDRQIESGLKIQVYSPVQNTFQIGSREYGTYTQISPNHSKYDRLVFNIKHKKILIDIKKRYNISRFSLIHAHSLFSNGYIALRLKKEYGTPYIVAVRNTDLYVFFQWMPHLRKLGLEILKEAQGIIFISQAYKDLLLKNYIPHYLREALIKKSKIIPNGIDDFWLKNKSTKPNRQNDKSINLLQIGEINKNKNYITTIKAIDILIKNGYKVTFSIAGRIKEKGIFKTLKGKDYLSYLGFVPKERLIETYKNNDIFILPSIHETFGLVYTEAMSQGLPIIYTKDQGFDGQFPEGHIGYPVNCNDPLEIAESVEKILSNYDQISQNCSREVDIYNWKTIADNYMDTYEAIVQSQNIE